MNPKRFTIAFTIMLLMAGMSPSWSQEARIEVEHPLINYKNFSADIGLRTSFKYQERLFWYKSLATISLQYDISKRFDISGSYRLSTKHNHISHGEVAHKFDEGESRITADLIYKSKRKDLYRIKNKLRYQVSDFLENDEKVYLRNKTTIDYKITSKFKPYYGIELIYRMDKHYLNSFRVHMGNTMELFKKEIGTYFIIENELQGQVPVDLNYIVGIKLKL